MTQQLGRQEVGNVLEALGGRRSEFKGMVSYTVEKGRVIEALEWLRSNGFEMLSDIFGIDWLTYPGFDRTGEKRFTVAYNVYGVENGSRIFIRVSVDDGEKLPTATGIWRSASFMEREVFDMFGIEFEGHPDLRKLLTPEDLDGHPHRKDFPIGETPTLFNDGRYLDPAAFRAGIIGSDAGLTGWKGGARKGVRSDQGLDLVGHEVTGQPGEPAK
ncbi:MAG TPA: NADH-quinone oxidoreductase subunit C [Trueperaceae bacterium]